ncbi:MAG: acyl-CoA thioesterase [Proteobacteria bacterium]|nr:acyl-CoA thioesterase [Pseudomonadota bacterium]
MSYPVVYTRKVRFSDADLQGHVFNANYFVYFDDAVTDYLEALGLPYAAITARGHDLVLARAECDFRSSGAFGETLRVGVKVARVGNTSVTFRLRVEEETTRRVVAEGVEVYVVLDRESHRPTAVPSYLREAVARLQNGEAG